MTPDDLPRPLHRHITVTEQGCWLRNCGVTNSGHTVVKFQRRMRLAHRVVYTALVGPIPDGLVIDHTCHNRDDECAGGVTCLHRRCMNPAHMEPVTNAENARRSRHTTAGRSRCVVGHELPEKGRNGRRVCRECQRLMNKAYYDRQRAIAANGHPESWPISYSSYCRGCHCDGCVAAYHAHRATRRGPLPSSPTSPSPVPTQQPTVIEAVRVAADTSAGAA